MGGATGAAPGAGAGLVKAQEQIKLGEIKRREVERNMFFISFPTFSTRTVPHIPVPFRPILIISYSAISADLLFSVYYNKNQILFLELPSILEKDGKQRFIG